MISFLSSVPGAQYGDFSWGQLESGRTSGLFPWLVDETVIFRGWWWGGRVVGHKEAPWALVLENPIQQMGSETRESGH